MEKTAFLRFVITIFVAVPLLFFGSSLIEYSLRSASLHLSSLIGAKYESHSQELASYNRFESFRDTSEALKKLMPQRAIYNQDSFSLATVIYREPKPWQGPLWLDVGRRYNTACGKEVIGVNSPVVVGDVLIGYVEKVYDNSSKVRLIGDPTLSIAVRIAKSEELVEAVEHRVDALLDLLKTSDQRGLEAIRVLEESMHSIQALLDIKSKKSSIHHAFVRGHEIGHSNMGYATLEGEAFTDHDSFREDDIQSSKGLLMVTSGLDKLFPKGLVVGKVTEILPDAHSAQQLTIKAKTIHLPFHDIQHVQVLPPMPDADLSH